MSSVRKTQADRAPANMQAERLPGFKTFGVLPPPRKGQPPMAPLRTLNSIARRNTSQEPAQANSTSRQTMSQTNSPTAVGGFRTITPYQRQQRPLIARAPDRPQPVQPTLQTSFPGFQRYQQPQLPLSPHGNTLSPPLSAGALHNRLQTLQQGLTSTMYFFGRR